MEKDKKYTDSHANLPDDVKHIANYYRGEPPRTPTWYSLATYWTGLIGTVFASIYTGHAVADKMKEVPSNWAKIKVNDGLFRVTLKSLGSWVDPKQWKSHASALGVIVGGVVLSNFARKKVEQSTFERRYGKDAIMEADRVEAFIKAVEEGRQQPNSQRFDTMVSDVQHEQRLAEPEKTKSF